MEIEQEKAEARLVWKGVSQDRFPVQFLNSLVQEWAAKLKHVAVTVELRQLEYMNSATVQPLVSRTRRPDASGMPIRVLLDDVDRQQTHPNYMSAIARTLQHVSVNGVVLGLVRRPSRRRTIDPLRAPATVGTLGSGQDGPSCRVAPTDGAGRYTGHGVVAGLIMMMVQSSIRTVVCGAPGADAALSPAAVLSQVNASLWANLQQVGDGHYMTASALRIDGGTIHYAGLHQDILVCRTASRRVERIETTGVWIGLMPNIAKSLEDRSLVLEPGDVVLLYSDGITERSEDGKMLETSGLASRFQELAAQSTAPGSIVQGIIGQVAGRKLDDDVTALAMRYRPGV